MNPLEVLRAQIMAQQPTDEQRDAIFADEGEFLLRAAPGSGKTWTSARRFIWRGANRIGSRGGLALLSFTNTAVREFKDATLKTGQTSLLSEPNYLSTFDAFVERFVISPFGHLVTGGSRRPRLLIAPRPSDWSNNKLKGWLELANGRKQPVQAWDITPFPKDNGIRYKTSFGKELDFRYHNPVDELFKLGFYTHAQRVFLACRVLASNDRITECLARRFPEIIVDEAQDTNIWLLMLLDMLHAKGARITLVGDPDQCIYEFGMAEATSLEALKERWSLKQYPLSQSRRCNDTIATAVRNVSGNHSFIGSGPPLNEHSGPFITRVEGTGFGECVDRFRILLASAGIPESNAAILGRGNTQIGSLQGQVNYSELQGVTKVLAKAAFLRDVRKDYKEAHKLVDRSVRDLTVDEGFWEIVDEQPDTEHSVLVRRELWHFVRTDSGLPSIQLPGSEWVAKTRASMTGLFQRINVQTVPSLGQWIRRTGLAPAQQTLPLFEEQSLFPSVRQETIHQVKGESIDGVLVIGSAKFFNAAMKAVQQNTADEEKRVAYVGMTRARHALLIGLPAAHFDRHQATWNGWGFKTLN